MRAHRMLMGWVIVAGVVGVCASCTQSKPTAGPGQLPARDSNDSTPVKISATTYFAHGHLLERSGNLEAAVEQYRKALEAQPDFLTARNRLGITLNALGRHAEATAEFRRALAINPGQAHLHNNLAFSLYAEGNTADAEAAARRALELKPDFARARMNLGLILAKQERYDAALGEFRQGVGEADAYYNLALVQSEAGRFTDAVRSLDQALRIDPGNELARQHLHQIADRASQQDAGMTPAPYATATPVSPAPSPVDAAYASSGADTPREMLSPVDMSSPSGASSDPGSSSPTAGAPGDGSSAGSGFSAAASASRPIPAPTVGGFDETGVNHAFITPGVAQPHTPAAHPSSFDAAQTTGSAIETSHTPGESNTIGHPTGHPHDRGVSGTDSPQSSHDVATSHGSTESGGENAFTHEATTGHAAAGSEGHAARNNLADPTPTIGSTAMSDRGHADANSSDARPHGDDSHPAPLDTHANRADAHASDAPPAIVPVGSAERARAAAAGFRALASTAHTWCFQGFFWQQCFAFLAVQAEANAVHGGVPGSAAESVTHGVQ
ncbi:MAG: tetratricopeptide repeat protein [Phycisphaerae bacterium]